MIDWWWMLAGAALIVTLGALAQRRGWIDFRGDGRRGGGSTTGIVGSLDEVFAPTRHEAQLERERQSSLPAPAPVPGDGPLGVPVLESDPDEGEGYRGRIRL